MPKLIKKYFPGDSFGELALLYNAPRAATIISSSDCVLFALDRETFNHIVKDAASKKREKYESFLNNIELLDTMKPYERTQIADALKPMKFDKGDYVVKEVIIFFSYIMKSILKIFFKKNEIYYNFNNNFLINYI